MSLVVGLVVVIDFGCGFLGFWLWWLIRFWLWVSWIWSWVYVIDLIVWWFLIVGCTWWQWVVVECDWVLGVVVGSLSFGWLVGMVVVEGVLWVC